MLLLVIINARFLILKRRQKRSVLPFSRLYAPMASTTFAKSSVPS